MRAVEESCCVVTVCQVQGGSPCPPARSCSGVFIHNQPPLVLCSSLVFLPFLTDTNVACLPSSRKLFVSVEQLTGGVPKVSQHKAQLVQLVPCPQFHQAAQAVFQQADQWAFYKGQDDDDDDDDEQPKGSACLSWFALLRVDGPVTGCSLPHLSSRSLRKGCELLACGSPFGSFCSDVFMSTVSKGIVSNLAGEENVLILTDARCLPGTEGGGVFIRSGQEWFLVGLIASPLCWKASEWIGLTLVCSLHTIVRNIKLGTEVIPAHLKDGAQQDLCVGKVQSLPQVVFISSGHLWGTGIVMNPRLILTCRHVCNGNTSVTVTFKTGRGCVDVTGKVTFTTKETSPYDVALVQLKEHLGDAVTPALASDYETGEDVYVISYGALGQSCGPSLTSGVLCRSVSCRSHTVMLQSTCAVQAGASGGALVRANTGELLGLVSSNTKDVTARVNYPHLNFSIPITLLKPMLHIFVLTNDTSSFKQLDVAEDWVKELWQLQSQPWQKSLSKL